MKIEKSVTVWILEGETKDDIDFIHEFFGVHNCSSIHIPRKTNQDYIRRW